MAEAGLNPGPTITLLLLLRGICSTQECQPEE
jgi:hypothetical protein